MVAEYDSGRFRDIAETILATNDVQVIEDRKKLGLKTPAPAARALGTDRVRSGTV